MTTNEMLDNCLRKCVEDFALKSPRRAELAQMLLDDMEMKLSFLALVSLICAEIPIMYTEIGITILSMRSGLTE